MKYSLLFLLAGAFLGFTSDKPEMLKPEQKFTLHVPEPSDICLTADKQHYIVVSDNGFVFETDLNFHNTRKANFKSVDCEGVYADADYIYVLDESLRKITLLDPKTLETVKSNSLTYSGGRNKGFECLAYNQKKGCFVTVTEKNPIIIWELDKNLNKLVEYPFKGASDISGATFFNGRLFFLSDEDRKIMEVNPENYSVIKEWSIPVLNPEGITFSPEGKLIISSDDMSKVFVFKPI